VVFALSCALAACGGNDGIVAGPYESCDASEGDVCSNSGFECVTTTLPASVGYTGQLCTTGCDANNPCPALIDNYDAICVNGQCYTECIQGDDTCPYGTGCLDFSDQDGNPVSVCSP
jgi:hypothetical protein